MLIFFSSLIIQFPSIRIDINDQRGRYFLFIILLIKWYPINFKTFLKIFFYYKKIFFFLKKKKKLIHIYRYRYIYVNIGIIVKLQRLKIMYILFYTKY